MTVHAMSVSSESSEEFTWISWYCHLPGHSWMVEVDTAFIEDAFNLYGLRNDFGDIFKDCIEILVGGAPEDPDCHRASRLYPYLKNLYGLIHARFITTSRGLAMMTAKFENGDFGRCPRYLCRGALVAPVGLSNSAGVERVQLYCSRCQDVFNPPMVARHGSTIGDSSDSDAFADTFHSSRSGSSAADAKSASDSARGAVVPSKRKAPESRPTWRPRRDSFEHELDGAYFGASFPHLMLVVKPQLLLPRIADAYVPRIYGFKVHNQKGRASLLVGDAATAPTAWSPTSAHKAASGAGSNGSVIFTRKVDKPLTSSYPEGERPAEDDFVSTSDDDNAMSHAAKRPRTGSSGRT